MRILFCEDVASVKFLEGKGVTFDRAICTLAELAEATPYLDENDIVLLMIHGFTYLSKAEIFDAIKSIVEIGVLPLENLLVLSDVEVSGMRFDYFLYDEDPIKEDLVFYSGGKPVKTPSVDVKAKGNLPLETQNRLFKRLSAFPSTSKECAMPTIESRPSVYSTSFRESDAENEGLVVMTDIFASNKEEKTNENHSGITS